MSKSGYSCTGLLRWIGVWHLGVQILTRLSRLSCWQSGKRNISRGKSAHLRFYRLGFVTPANSGSCRSPGNTRAIDNRLLGGIGALCFRRDVAMDGFHVGR